MSGTSSQTVGALITLAQKMSGAIGQGQVPQAQETQDAFNILNAMLETWNADRYLVYGLEDIACTSTGAESYTIGTGQSFNVARPTDIEAAYLRQYPQSQGTQFPVDFQMELLTSYEDYSRISVKTLSSFSRYAFYDAAYPVGNIYFWPAPLATGGYELHVLVKTPLVSFTSLTQTLSLPPSYTDSVVYNLACRLRPYYGLAPEPTLVSLAKSSLNVLRNSNAQVPRMQIDSTLYGNNGGQGWYNVFSDNN